jgi:hypothetical protein
MLAYYKESLLDLFEQLQRLHTDPANSSELCCKIQQTLIRRIIYVEGRLQETRRHIAECKKSLALRDSATRDKERAQVLKQMVDHAHWKIDEYQNVLKILRGVGDGLAFSFLSKWDIKPMTFKERAGFLSGKAGFTQERRVLSWACTQNIVVILNDLTNCLRHGDITVPKGEVFALIEMKTSRNSNARTRRQADNLQKISSYLETDEITGLYGPDLSMRRSPLQIEERTRTDELNEAIAEALVHGNVLRQVEDGLYYYVETPAGHLDPGVVLERFTTPPLVAYLNMGKYDNFAYYPFTLSIRDPETLYRFYEGSLLIFVIIDMAVVSTRLETHNLQVELLDDREWALQITPQEFATIDGFTPMRIGRHFLMRVPFEFLSLDWFLDELIERCNHIFRNPSGPGSELLGTELRT